MYWNGRDYDKMAQLATDIYIDYNIRAFPINENEICRLLKLRLIPYSYYSETEQYLLRKKSSDAFFYPATLKTPPTVFYNDRIHSYGRQRLSIFHEIKHYVNHDSGESIYDDNMADYFARYFMCPIPYLIKMGIDSEMMLINNHLMSEEAAINTICNVRNRRAKFGNKIFDYEKPLIALLC